MNNTKLNELKAFYREKRPEISARLAEFRAIWDRGDGNALFKELSFCLFTPQSKAVSCWAAVERVCAKGLLLDGAPASISPCLKGVRFHNNKSRYLAEARKAFGKDGVKGIKTVLSRQGEPKAMRDWLAKNIKGLGLKEASHYLRNIGLGDDIAIIDRHILRNLKEFGFIREVPRSITRRNYMALEEKVTEFSKISGIPMAHLDMLLWCKEAGEVFK